MADDPSKPVRLVIDNAEEVPAQPITALRPVAPEPDEEPGDRGGGDDGGEEPGYLELPPDCPVIPCGVNGDVSYYLDAMGQLREVPADKHSRLRIAHLFGSKVHLLECYWPRKQLRENANGDEIWVVTGWKPEVAAMSLTSAAARKGLWDPQRRVRGRGAWLDDEGRLILHCGDVLLVGPKWAEPGWQGEHVYPAGPAIMRPASGLVKANKDNPCEWLYSLLKSWNWRRKDLDARLLLGWIGASILGGALDWRPLAWITGGTGTGKSTLHKLIGLLFGEHGLIQVANTTPAGVWQTLRYDSLPVNIDELEARADPRKTDQIVELARWAASGAKILRGGGEHQSTEFTVRTCMLFSSEFIPPLRTADRNRMAILELDPLGGEKAPTLDAKWLKDVGQKLRRRLVDGWPHLAEMLDRYRAALQGVGHSARGQDVFGTLLAVAEILLRDGEPFQHEIDELAQLLNVDHLAEISDNASEPDRCLQRLATTAIPLDASGFSKRPVAEWAAIVNSDSVDDNQVEAARVLGNYGLRVIVHEGQAMLAVSTNNIELAKIFAGTLFQDEVWNQALRRIDGHVIPRGANGKPKNVWFPGGEGKCTFVPLKLIVQPEHEKLRRERGSKKDLLPL